MDLLSGFINTGLDDLLAKGLANKTGLVAIQKQVTRKGRTFIQTFYVSQAEAEQHTITHDSHTNETYKKNGQYVPARQKLHKEIVDNIVKSAGETNKSGKPVAILLGGGSASGKSTIRKATVDIMLQSNNMTASTVDSDEIKDLIPEFSKFKKEDVETSARRVHEESSDISAMALDSLISHNKNFVFDGTMKSPSKYIKLVSKLKKAGYEVHMIIADVPLDVAIQRSDARAKRSGRKVPHDIITQSHTGVPQTVSTLRGMVDSYAIYDNSGSNPELIASNTYESKDKLKAFMNKGGVKYE